MIEIRHKSTGAVLLTYPADTLEGATLDGETLNYANLASVNLTGASLSAASLVAADLRGADLSGAFLDGCDLTGADFRKANLAGANLQGARLDHAILDDADLSDSFLMYAIFFQTDLARTDFAGSQWGDGSFLQCPTLGDATGLDEVNHLGHTTFDPVTEKKLVPKVTNQFLVDSGYTQRQIIDLRIQYSDSVSCFLSYARSDEVLANRLFHDLEEAGVDCWRDTHHATPGELWQPEMAKEIRSRDRFLFLCSSTSVTRENVIREVREALAAQEESETRKILPLDSDGFLLNLDETTLTYDSNETSPHWLSRIRQHQIIDFRGWEQDTIYSAALTKLLSALKRRDR